MYASIQDHEHADFKEVVKSDRFNLYIYPEKIDFMSLGLTDHYLIMRLLNKEEEYDNRYILCCNSGALQWPKELYQYYFKDSVPVTKK
ncbi:hypothetical protein CUN85_10920 [Methanolobus halotolerans]|uniref:Methanogenesis regulatory protein FilR1 middle domain-containing protein n=2 Tax=Methanolobus halotolerans TaxID=2052935 RepID=A0A4E0Q824_9EURY|nr:hypothetical protein CUN85_10920 [Methanolobus halotolerans]